MNTDEKTRSDMTKHLLAKSLKELMDERSLEKISIGDITSRAGFRRQTFYYHFNDVYSLLVWTFTEDLERYFSRNNAKESWRMIVLTILEYLEDNREFCLSAYRSIGNDAIKELIGIEVNKISREIIDKEMSSMKIPEKAVEFITTFATGGIANIAEEWLKGTLKMKKEDIVEYTAKITDVVRLGLIMFPETEKMKKIIPVENE